MSMKYFTKIPKPAEEIDKEVKKSQGEVIKDR